MINNQQKRVEAEESELEAWEAWMENIPQNRCLMEHIGKHYHFHAGRLALLKDILGRIENGNEEELAARIYEYGSMVKRQDLIARQMFLWLFAMAEEMGSLPKACVEAE